MEDEYYRNVIRSVVPHKRLGQNFLVKRYVAVAEADHCIGKRVVELGAGLGILTEELCKVAKSVTAIEIDRNLFRILSEKIKHKNCNLINSDFFDLDPKSIKADTLASNVPYNLSSKTLMWLLEQRMPAILCLQKEFVNRMVASVGSENYSRLSVFCSLQFDVSKGMDVPADCFYPMPKVDSSLVQLRPKKSKITKEEMGILSLIMEHKNKKVRNAIEDSSKALGISKQEIRALYEKMEQGNQRVSKLTPKDLLDVAREVISGLK